MKNLRKSWKLIALFAFAAIVCTLYVGRSKALAQSGTTTNPAPVEKFTGLFQTSLDQNLFAITTNDSGLTMDVLATAKDTTGSTVWSATDLLAPGASSITPVPLSLITIPGPTPGSTLVVKQRVNLTFDYSAASGSLSPDFFRDVCGVKSAAEVTDANGGAAVYIRASGSQNSLIVRTKDSALNDQKSVCD